MNLNISKVYFISGLGADKRAFSFLDLAFCEAVFIDWAEPDKNESLASYAEKLFSNIKDQEATIVGLSFGGMLATEIAKRYPNTKVIIVSSAKTYRELPAYLRMWRHLPLYRFHSKKVTTSLGPFILKILGAKGVEQRRLQTQIMRDSNPAFTRWAIDAILNWKNEIVPSNVIHIHGDADTLLPFRYVKAHHTIEGGKHVLIMDQAKELSALLKQLIA